MYTVAVVVPCYNGFKYMGNCLESMENQTIKPEQIIIVDDCSTDDSYEQLQKYANESNLNILLLKNEKNSGPGISRKNAITNSKTDYVVFCDCDDSYESDFVEKAKECIKTTGADLILTDYNVIYDGEKKPANTVKMLQGKPKIELIANCGMSLCDKIIKRELFDDVEFPALYHSEDGVVLLQIIEKAKKVFILDVPFYNYFFRSNSASSKLSQRAFSDSVEAFDFIEKKFLDKYPQECEFLGIKYLLYCAVINGIKSETSYKKIKEQILTFFEKYPKWYKNKYIYSLGRGKRLYLNILRMRMFFLFPIMAKMHTIVVLMRIKKRKG